MYGRLLGDSADPVPNVDAPDQAPDTVDFGAIGDSDQFTAQDTSDATLASTGLAHWAAAGGICKPADGDSLALFKAFQAQLNRVADAKSFAKIVVDGTIGSLTLGLASKVFAAAPAGMLSSSFLSSCSAAAGALPNLTTSVQQFADSLGASSSVSSPAPARTPTTFNAQTRTLQPQGAGASILDTWNRLSSGQKLVIGGLAGIGAIFGYRRYRASRSK